MSTLQIKDLVNLSQSQSVRSRQEHLEPTYSNFAILPASSVSLVNAPYCMLRCDLLKRVILHSCGFKG